jgi:hypothetical protein
MTGKIYRLRCQNDACENGAFEQFMWSNQREGATCPACGHPAVDNVGQQRVFGANFAKPFISEAWGVAPQQVEEAKRQHPHHEFTPTGAMVMRNTRQYERVRRDLGIQD